MARLNGYPEDLKCPLTELPSIQSEIVSPMIGNSQGLPEPHRPGSNEFKEELEVFKDVREKVKCKYWPKEFLAANNPSGSDGSVPELFLTAGVRNYEPKTAGQLVAMDDPIDVGIHLYKELKKRGVPIHKNYLWQPFVEHYVNFIKELSVRLEDVLIKAFQAKYFFGLERPETYLEIDGDILTDAKGGAPKHFSYPAGHGSVFAETYLVLKEFFNLDESTDMEILDCLYQGSSYRTMLGVHYPQDNHAGFILTGILEK